MPRLARPALRTATAMAAATRRLTPPASVSRCLEMPSRSAFWASEVRFIPPVSTLAPPLPPLFRAAASSPPVPASAEETVSRCLASSRQTWSASGSPRVLVRSAPSRSATWRAMASQASWAASWLPPEAVMCSSASPFWLWRATRGFSE